MPARESPRRAAGVRQVLSRIAARFEPDETSILVVVAVVVGILGGYGAIVFRWLVAAVQGLVLGGGEGGTVALLARQPWWRIVLVPVAGGLVVGPLIHFLAPEARGTGVPAVLGALSFRRGVIRPVVALIKMVASAVTIACGGSVGREGPIVQIGAAMGSGCGQLLRFSPQRLRTLIGCGAAAGIAATFNAPIAGAFFAMEILLRDFAVVTFAPIIVASVTATAISRGHLGDTPAFPVPGFELGGVQELPFYLALGGLVGLLAVVYVRSLGASDGLLDRTRLPRWLQPAAGGLVLGVLLLRFPEVYGVGYDTMVEVLAGELAWTALLTLLLAKLVAVNVTLGSGFSGGVFAPALFLGGMLGGACGQAVDALLEGSAGAGGAFAMVGMAAMTGAATGGPLTAILILFEMTGEYRVILPLMITSIGAALVYRAFLRESVFTQRFAREGRPLGHGRESSILRDHHVEDIMELNPRTVPEDADFDEVLHLFLDTDEEHYYVVDRAGRLGGRISIHDVKDLLSNKNLGHLVLAVDIAEPCAAVVHRRDTLEDCLLRLGEHDSADLPVVHSRERPVLVGVVRRRAVFEVYNREVLRRRESGIHLVTGEARLQDCVELPAEYGVRTLSPPGSWVGRSLRELELRRRFDITVLAVKRRGRIGGAANRVPVPDEPLAAGEQLIILGTLTALDGLLAVTHPRAFPPGKDA